MITPELNKYKNIIFLDVDGVLNCQLFYTERYKHLTQYNGIPFYKTVKKYLRKLVKTKEISRLDYYKGEMCPMRMQLLNELCEETNSAVVLSASMRAQYSPEDLQKIFNHCGATFTIIDKTGHCRERIRGVEIHEWMRENCMAWFGVNYFDFYRYAIIDDDSDMLLWQQDHFFQTDNYSGLTPTTTYKIKRLFTHKTFHYND
jgi:hypothetical protein